MHACVPVPLATNRREKELVYAVKGMLPGRVCGKLSPMPACTCRRGHHLGPALLVPLPLQSSSDLCLGLSTPRNPGPSASQALLPGSGLGGL